MKNLSELQGELYKLSAALDALSRQVEDLKPKEDSGAPNYAALEELARQAPIQNPSLAGAGEERQERYLRLLSTAAALEGQGAVDKLLYLCRVATGSKCPRPALDLQKMAYETDRLDWQSAAGSLKELALPLLLDMLMVCNLKKPAEDRALEFISSTAELLECNEEDVAVTAQLAAALLSQDEEAFWKITVKHAYPELGYLVPEKWLENSRIKNLRYPKREVVYAKVATLGITAGIQSTKPAVISANEVVASGAFVTQRMPLVKFSRRQPESESGSGRILTSLYKFTEPDPKPITASWSGIALFQDDPGGYRRIYIKSPFDPEVPR